MKRKNVVETPYKKLEDVPYELTEPVLIKMQKMEHGLKFILDNLTSKDLTAETAAKAAGFGTQYYQRLFKSYFGMPFQRYVTKLRIRQAARDIRGEHYPKGIGKRYMFQTLPSFTRAFKREFGISPREFYYGNYTIPDMPFRDSVEGLDVGLEYKVCNAFSVEGTAIVPPLGNDTYLMDAVSLAFTEEGAAQSMVETQIGGVSTLASGGTIQTSMCDICMAISRNALIWSYCHRIKWLRRRAREMTWRRSLPAMLYK